MMKDSSSCAIYGIEDSQKCRAGCSVHCVCVREFVCARWSGALYLSLWNMNYNFTSCALHLNGCKWLYSPLSITLFHLIRTPSPSLHRFFFLTEAGLTLCTTLKSFCDMNTKPISKGKQSELDHCVSFGVIQLICISLSAEVVAKLSACSVLIKKVLTCSSAHQTNCRLHILSGFTENYHHML